MQIKYIRLKFTGLSNFMKATNYLLISVSSKNLKIKIKLIYKY